MQRAFIQAPWNFNVFMYMIARWPKCRAQFVLLLVFSISGASKANFDFLLIFFILFLKMYLKSKI